MRKQRSAQTAASSALEQKRGKPLAPIFPDAALNRLRKLALPDNRRVSGPAMAGNRGQNPHLAGAGEIGDLGRGFHQAA